MKKAVLSFAAFVLLQTAIAQAPAGFNYQGIARTSTGAPMASQALGLRITIHDGSATGTAVYQETQSTTTNAYGLYVLTIGSGTAVTGTLGSVDWAGGAKYLQIELDPAGGTAYTDLGATQLLSVPYALNAASVGSGTANYGAKFTGNGTVGNSQIYDNGTAVAIGSTSPTASYKFQVVNSATTSSSNAIHGIQGSPAATTVTSPGAIYGESSNGIGIIGVSSNQSAIYGTSAGAGFGGVTGINTSATGYGVWGLATAAGVAGYFDGGTTGRGVIVPSGNSGFGLATGLGARLHVSGSQDINTTIGALTFGHQATLTRTGTTATTQTARGLVSYAGNSSVENHGVLGYAGATTGGSTYNVGGFFLASPATASTGNSYGVYGNAGSGANNIGVFGATVATGTGNYAGYFSGNVQVTGSIAKGSGTFKIDHPLDPENKYLYHSFVESPDMMNIYNGNITTDAQGYATVTLPGYFDALNKEFRYQLTVIGTFAQAIVKEEIKGNAFVIQTNQPSVKVSWQVTGIRHDKYADAHRVAAEVEKEPEFKGKYLHPTEWSQPRSKGISFERPLPLQEGAAPSRD